MAQDIPSKLPEWCSDPSGDTDTTGKTEPTSGQKAAGWQPAGSTAFPDGFPVRQIMNWLLNLTWQWLVWLSAATRRTTDLHDDGPLPGYGDAPTVAAGLGPVSAGDFAARAYVDGYEVGPVDSPAHTYTASKDTYWDLGRDGGWTAVEVNAGDPAPSVTADSVRVYKVTTDGSDRTAVVDYRPARLEVSKALELKEAIRLGLNSFADAAAAAVVRLQVPYSSAVSFTYLGEFADAAASEGTTRIYLDGYGIPVMVRGASWDGTQWVTDASPPLLLSRIEWRGSDGLRVRQLDASVHTPNFADSVWEEQPDADHVRGLGIDGTLSIFNPATPSALYQAGTPKVFAEADEAVAHRAWAGQLGTYFQIYSLLLATVGTDDGAGNQANLGGELVSNATYDESTGKWARQNAGADSFKLELGSHGLRLLKRAAGDASPWNDDVDAADGWAPQKLMLSAAAAGLDGTWSVDTNPTPANMSANITSSTGALAGAVFPLDKIRDGAIITGARWFGSAGSEGANVRAFVHRYDPVSRTARTLKATDSYDTFAGVALGTANEITIDESVALRTVDQGSYAYALVIVKESNVSTTIEGVQVDYA